MISTWKQWLYIGYTVSVLYIGYIVSVLYINWLHCVSAVYWLHCVSAVYWLHCVSAVYWLHCVRRRSRHTSILLSIRLTYVRETTMKYDVLRTIPLNIHTSQNENETVYKRCVFNKHVHCSSTPCTIEL